VHKFNKYDRSVLQSDLPDLLSYSDKIYAEYSFLPYAEFVSGHISLVRALLQGQHSKRIDAYEACLKKKTLRVGIYAGSFNPFHKGHLDIVKQATHAFDKVIVAIGQNPDKLNASSVFSSGFSVFPFSIPGVPSSYETVKFRGTLADVFQHYSSIPSYQVSIIRGLRDVGDLKSELVQRQFVFDLAEKTLPYTFFVSSPELSYISSSAIRQLRLFGMSLATCRNLLGVFGTIGSGKSYFARLVASTCGYVYVSADYVFKEYVRPLDSYKDALCAFFEPYGISVLAPNGSYNSEAMTSLLFTRGAWYNPWKVLNKFNTMNLPFLLSALDRVVSDVPTILEMVPMVSVPSVWNRCSLRFCVESGESMNSCMRRVVTVT